MATLALGLAGAALGGWLAPGAVFLGLTGASLGFTVGSMLGGVLFPPKLPGVEGPRISDLKVQTSAYGNPIPKIYGTVRIAGNVIWATDIREESNTEEQGGKGGPTQEITSYKYFVSMAIGLCEGTISGIRRIWAEGDLIYDVSAGLTADQIEANEAKIPQIKIYTGSETQTADPTIEADKGAANTPAYRGTAYVVLTDFPLTGSYFGRIPQLTFEVVADGLDGDCVANIGERSAYDMPVDAGVGYTQYREGFAINDDGTFEVLYPADYRTAPPPSSRALIRTTYDMTGFPLQSKFSVQTNHYLCEEHVILPIQNNVDICIIWDLLNGGKYWWSWEYGYNGPQDMTTDRLAPWHNQGAFASAVYQMQHLVYLPPYGLMLSLAGVVGAPFGVDILLWNPGAKSNTNSYTTTAGGTQGIDWAQLWYDTTRDKLYLLCDGNKLYRYDVYKLANYVDYTSDDPFEYAWDFSSLTIGTPPFTVTPFVDAASTYPFVVHEDSFTIFGGRSGGGQAFQFALGFDDVSPADSPWGLTCVDYTVMGYSAARPFTVYNGSPVALFWDSDNFYQFRLGASLESVCPTLGEIVSDICLRTGLVAGDIDVTALTEECCGYVLPRPMSARSAIEPLQKYGYFDAVESSGVIKFVLRGGAVAESVPATDLGARDAGSNEEPELSIERAQDEEVPQRVTVVYIEQASDYQPGSQYAQRIITNSNQHALEEMPIVMTAQKAAEIADTLLYAAWHERQKYKLNLGRKHAHLEPTDIIAVTDSNADVHRMRITEMNQSGMALAFQCVEEDAATYSPASVGAANPIVQSVGRAGNTGFEILDCPLLRGQDDGVSSYAAIAALSTTWPGAVLYRVIAGARTELGSVSLGTAIGAAASALGDFQGGNIFDELNTVLVDVFGAVLANATEAAVLAGANAAYLGGEILQFKSCALQSGSGVGTRYALSGLLRGRLGTEDAMSTHAVGDRFALLSETGGMIPIGDASDVGVTRSYAAATLGGAVGSARDLLHTGRALKPLAPWWIAAGREADYDVVVRWVRRSRMYTEWRDYVDASLGESVEAYEVDIYSDSAFTTIVRTVTGLTAATFTYTAAQQAADFPSSAGRIGEVSVDIAQLSSAVGRGLVARTTVAVSAVDPYTVLLLHFDGANGSTTFTDECAHTLTPVGGAAHSTAQYKFGTGASLLTGTGPTRFLNVTHAADLLSGASDFCLEMWVYPTTASGTQTLWTKRISGGAYYHIYLGHGPNLVFTASFDGATWGVNITGSAGLTANVWQHVACVRYGNTWTLYKDGVSLGTTTASGTIYDVGQAVNIGANDAAGAYPLIGHIDELRLSIGTARYTSPFTPPTAPFTKYL